MFFRTMLLFVLISIFPIAIYTMNDSMQKIDSFDEEDESTCSICFYQFSETKKKITLPCFDKHTMCLPCLDEWSLKKTELISYYQKDSDEKLSCPFK